MGEFVTLSWPTHFRSLMEGLWHHFQYNYDTDFEIVLNNDESSPTSIEAHRLILSIFCPGITNVTENKIIIGEDNSDINKTDIHSLMEFIYRGTIKVDEGRLKQLRSGAAAIGLTIMVDLIDNFIGVKLPEPVPPPPADHDYDVREPPVDPDTEPTKRKRKLTEAGIELQLKVRQRQKSLQDRMGKRLAEVLAKSRKARKNQKTPAKMIRTKIADSKLKYKNKAEPIPTKIKDDVNTVKIKRGVGRPRKHKIVEGIPVKDDGNIVKMKRGVGRPRKNNSVESISVTDDGNIVTIKRVGRPRKFKSVEESKQKPNEVKHSMRHRKIPSNSVHVLLKKQQANSPIKLMEPVLKLVRVDSPPVKIQKPPNLSLKRWKFNKTAKISKETKAGDKQTGDVATPPEGTEIEPPTKSADVVQKKPRGRKRNLTEVTNDHNYQNPPIQKKIRTTNQKKAQETIKKRGGGRKVLLEIDPDMDPEEFDRLYCSQNAEINKDTSESSIANEVAVIAVPQNDVNIEVPQHDVNIEVPQNDVNIEVPQNDVNIEVPRNDFTILKSLLKVSENNILIDDPQNFIIIEDIHSEAIIDIPQNDVIAVPQKNVTAVPKKVVNSKSRRRDKEMPPMEKIVFSARTAEEVQSMTASERTDWLNKMMIQFARQKINHWTCELCGETRAGWYRQLSHIKCHVNPDERIKCPHCDFVAEVNFDLTRHINCIHNVSAINVNSTPLNYNLTPRPKNIKCPNCSFTCATNSELVAHRMAKHMGSHMCDECTDLFPSKTKLTFHKLTWHCKMPQFTCNVCQFGTTDKSAFKIHLETHTEKEACDVCGKECEPEDMKKHRESHTSVNGSGQLQCHLCSFSTDTPYCLKFHLRTLHKLPPAEVAEIVKCLKSPEDD